ncbi:hypothetical protein [Aliamphritea spongicola]|nr:hypothetical protein [Aliamphritea spongicola]
MRDYWWVMFVILGLAFSQWVSGSDLCAGFFKTVLGICGIIVLGIVSLVTFVIDPAFNAFSEIEYQEESSLENRLVYGLLKEQPFAQWQSSIERYDSFFELTPSLIEASELPVDALPFTAPGGQGGHFRVDEDNMYFSYFASPLPGWLVLYEEGDSELVDESRAEFAVLLLFAGPLVVILLAMLLGIGYLLYAFGRPMRALEKAMEGFSQDPRVRLAPEHGKLIPNIVTAFNGMAQRLDTTLTEQQVMIAAIPMSCVPRLPGSVLPWICYVARKESPSGRGWKGSIIMWMNYSKLLNRSLN